MLTTQDTFSFVTDLSISEEDEEAVFATLVQALYAKSNEQITEDKQQDEVFKSIYIPRTLQELTLEDIDKLRQNNQEAMFQKLTGVNQDKAADDDDDNADESNA